MSPDLSDSVFRLLEGPAYDDRLSAKLFRLLTKIIIIADAEAVPGEQLKTRARDWQEFAELFGLGRTQYFAHLRGLKIAGYLETQATSRGVILRPLPGYGVRESGNPGPTTTRVFKSLTAESSSRDLTSPEIPDSRIPIVETLAGAGIGEPLRSDLARDPEVELDWIQAHVDYARLQGDSVRILAHRLKVRDVVDVETFDKLRQMRADVAKFWDE